MYKKRANEDQDQEEEEKKEKEKTATEVLGTITQCPPVFLANAKDIDKKADNN